MEGSTSGGMSCQACWSGPKICTSLAVVLRQLQRKVIAAWQQVVRRCHGQGEARFRCKPPQTDLSGTLSAACTLASIAFCPHVSRSLCAEPCCYARRSESPRSSCIGSFGGHIRRWRTCSQMSEPPQLLHVLLRKLCRRNRRPHILGKFRDCETTSFSHSLCRFFYCRAVWVGGKPCQALCLFRGDQRQLQSCARQLMRVVEGELVYVWRQSCEHDGLFFSQKRSFASFLEILEPTFRAQLKPKSAIALRFQK